MARNESYDLIDCKERLLLIEIRKDKYGGYNQAMLEKDLKGMELDFYVCSRCNGLMRKACLINGPDQILVCVVCMVKGEDSIPMVKARKNIPKLRVKCLLMNRGCVWKGNLEEIDAHLDECTKFILSCPKMCGIKLKRSELQNHFETECQFRIVKCQYCGITMQYKELENHYKTCLEFPIACPNKCLKNLVRKESKLHIDEECPNTLVACPYKEMGCEVLSKRSVLQEHGKIFISDHFRMAKVFYSNEVNKLELNVKDQELKFIL